MERIVIIGGTSGIGEALASQHLERGDHVTVLGRDTARLPSHRSLVAIATDLSLVSGQDAASAALADTTIDRLVFTAGVLTARVRVTAEGRDATFMVNHVARSRMLAHLSPVLARDARVGFISSWGSYRTPPPEGYRFGVPGRGGLSHALRSYIPNDALFAGFAAAHPGMGVLGYNPGPTRGTRLAARADTPVPMRLFGPLFRLAARDVAVVAGEFLAAMDAASPGISWRKSGRALPRPPHLLDTDTNTDRVAADPEGALQ